MVSFCGRHIPKIDPNKLSVGYFKTSDQLLPVLLILFDGCTAHSSKNEGQTRPQATGLFMAIQVWDSSWAIG
jgi:hypothetical protein